MSINYEYQKAWRKRNPEKCKEQRIRERANAYLKDPLWARKNELRRKFGLSIDTYNLMSRSQDDKCAICKQPETASDGDKVWALAVDHSHTTGRVRGLLCKNCNIGLGWLKENVEILKESIRYLEMWDRENL